MYESTAERIKALRIARGITQVQLAEKIGVGKGVIGKYEAGYVFNIKRPILEALADALETTPGYIMGWDADYSVYPGVEKLRESVQVPLLTEDGAEAFVHADMRLRADFALRFSGDTMINARVFAGDIVYIHKQDKVQNGEIAAVRINGCVTLRRYYDLGSYIELRAENPTAMPLRYERADAGKVAVLGKAVAFLSTLR